MGYIDQNLLPDERILFRTKKHIIIFFLPLMWTIFSIFAVGYMETNPFLVKINWLPGLVALIFWSSTFIEYLTSDFAVTNKRILMREGLLYRHTNETRLSTISQVNVMQSLLGQWLNYGGIVVNAFGAYDAFSMIDKPFQFQKAVNEQLDHLVRGA